MNAGLFGPIVENLPFAVERNPAVVPKVSELLLASCPAAVARLIIAVVVWVSIQCVLWAWSPAHIHQKCFEGFSPSFADFNAPTTIIVPMFSTIQIPVVAPPIHNYPRSVFLSGPRSWRLAMCAVSITAFLAADAATASCVSGRHQCGTSLSFVSTLTTEQPDRPAFRLGDDSNGRQLSKRLSRDVVELRHWQSPLVDFVIVATNGQLST